MSKKVKVGIQSWVETSYEDLAAAVSKKEDEVITPDMITDVSARKTYVTVHWETEEYGDDYRNIDFDELFGFHAHELVTEIDLEIKPCEEEQEDE